MDLENKVALVTGASRGIGKGIALELGQAGAIVYITGRTAESGKGPEGLPGSILETAREIEESGGKAFPVQCDHRDDSQVLKVFDQIDKQQGHLDILVNSVWGGYESMFEQGEFTWLKPFWEQPLWRWDAMFQAGVRAHYVSCVMAAQRMIRAQSGLIINISFWASQKLIGNVPYSVSKAATDKMTLFMAQQLKEYNVAVVSLYPGLVKTENVMRSKDYLDLSNAESPQFTGRAICALASDPDVMKYSGTASVIASLAIEYGFTDIDNKQPRPLTIEDF